MRPQETARAQAEQVEQVQSQNEPETISIADLVERTGSNEQTMADAEETKATLVNTA